MMIDGKIQTAAPHPGGLLCTAGPFKPVGSDDTRVEIDFRRSDGLIEAVSVDGAFNRFANLRGNSRKGWCLDQRSSDSLHSARHSRGYS
jgi:hypothetical protein